MVETFGKLTAGGQYNAAIEAHLENIVRSHDDLWAGYKTRLLKLHSLLEHPAVQTALYVSEGDSFIRFNSFDDRAGLNSLFFVYEIGSVFPNIRWRHLLGPGRAFDCVLLTKPTSFLPAFSFSLDQPITLMYWGEAVPYLSASILRNLRLSNFILKTNNPSRVEVSGANIAWPKSAYPLIDQELEKIATNYIFNSLMPPIFGGPEEIWFESPYIIIGDTVVHIFTVHKTICTFDKNTSMRSTGMDIVRLKVKVIDRNFSVRYEIVDVPRDCIDELIKRETPCEVIFIKSLRIRYDSVEKGKKPEIHYTIYPFESIRLFKEEGYGWLLSLISIILRERYIRTSDPFSFALTPEELKPYLGSIASLLDGRANTQVGQSLIESQAGIYTIAKILGVYIQSGSLILYLHPALFECLFSIIKVQPKKEDVVRLLRIASEYTRETKPSQSISNVFMLQDLFTKEFGNHLDFTTAKLLRTRLQMLQNINIPLSKSLALCLGG